MEPKKDDPGAIPEPSDRRIEFEALFIKLSVKQGSVQTWAALFHWCDYVIDIEIVQNYRCILIMYKVASTEDG